MLAGQDRKVLFPLGEVEVRLGVPPPGVPGVACFVETAGGVLADGLQHPVTGSGHRPCRRRQGTCWPAGPPRPGRRPGRRRSTPAAACASPKPAGEHRQLAEGALLRGGQQVIAPVDRRPQRLVPRVGGRPPVGQEPELIRQVRLDLLHRQRARPAPPPARSPAAGRPAPGRSGRSPPPRGQHVGARPGPKRHGRRTAAPPAPPRSSAGSASSARDGQRRHRVGGLTRDAQRFAAGRQHPQPRCSQTAAWLASSVQASSRCSQLSKTSSRSAERSRYRSASSTGTSPACRTPSASITCAATSSGSAMPASSASHTPSANRSTTAAGELHRQPCLPRPARPGQRDQPRLAQQLAQPGQLLLPAHKARQPAPAGYAALDAAPRAAPPAAAPPAPAAAAPVPAPAPARRPVSPGPAGKPPAHQPAARPDTAPASATATAAPATDTPPPAAPAPRSPPHAAPAARSASTRASTAASRSSSSRAASSASGSTSSTSASAGPRHNPSASRNRAPAATASPGSMRHGPRPPAAQTCRHPADQGRC